MEKFPHLTLYGKIGPMHILYNKSDLRPDYNRLVEFGAYSVIAMVIKTGIFHGDPMPQNIMVAKSPKMIDFSFAYKLSERQMDIVTNLFNQQKHGDIMRYLYSLHRYDLYRFKDSPESYGYLCGYYDELTKQPINGFSDKFDEHVQQYFDDPQCEIITTGIVDVPPLYFHNEITMPPLRHAVEFRRLAALADIMCPIGIDGLIQACQYLAYTIGTMDTLPSYDLRYYVIIAAMRSGFFKCESEPTICMQVMGDACITDEFERVLKSENEKDFIIVTLDDKLKNSSDIKTDLLNLTNYYQLVTD